MSKARDSLSSFQAQLHSTASKLRKLKGNDFQSLMKLKEKIVVGGNDFNIWVKLFQEKNGYALPDSLIYEFIKILYTSEITSLKPPRETNRYKFVLYAWIQNYWSIYGPIFTKAMFLKPHASTPSFSVPTVLNYDGIYSEVHQKLLDHKINIHDAAEQIAVAESNRLNTVKAVCFYEGDPKSILLCTYVVKKKHKILNISIKQKSQKEEPVPEKPQNIIWGDQFDIDDNAFRFWKNSSPDSIDFL